MPPRFAYWTIIAGGLPTAFRATDREELLPTFTRLKEKQPDAEMKWFARGKLWASPEEARGHGDRRFGNDDRNNRPRDRERQGRGDDEREHRGRDWRPGGEHRDPRQQFKDAKKDRNQRIKAEKFARKSGRAEAPRARPHGDPLAPERRPRLEGSRHGDAAANRKPWSAKPRGEKDGGSRPRPTGPAGDRHSAKPDRRAADWQNRGAKPQSREGFESQRNWSAKPPREKPSGDKVMRPSRPGGDRDRVKPPSGKEGGWRPRATGEGRPSGPAARQQTDWQPRGPKPQPRGGSSTGWKRDWTDKPPREKPHGDKLTRPPRTSSNRGGDRGPKSETRWEEKPRHEGRGTYRGEGHGNNSWKPKPPRDERSTNSGDRRPFAPRGFQRDRDSGSGGQEPPRPPAPRGPNREPRPSEQPEPSPPPRPSEPVIPPPGPPERGRLNRNKRHR